MDRAGKERDERRSGAVLKSLIARGGGRDWVDLEPGCAMAS